MARSRRFSVTPHVFKIAKAANRLRKAVDAHSELVERTNNSGDRSASARSAPRGRGKPASELTEIDAAYERNILRKLSTPIDRHFYIKLVGIKSPNSDGSSRTEAIQNLEESQELELRREPKNKVDSN